MPVMVIMVPVTLQPNALNTAVKDLDRVLQDLACAVSVGQIHNNLLYTILFFFYFIFFYFLSSLMISDYLQLWIIYST